MCTACQMNHHSYHMRRQFHHSPSVLSYAPLLHKYMHHGSHHVHHQCNANPIKRTASPTTRTHALLYNRFICFIHRQSHQMHGQCYYMHQQICEMRHRSSIVHRGAWYVHALPVLRDAPSVPSCTTAVLSSPKPALCTSRNMCTASPDISTVTTHTTKTHNKWCVYVHTRLVYICNIIS